MQFNQQPQQLTLAQQLINAIETLFSDQPIPDRINEANRFVTEFVKTREAWEAIPFLFQTPPTDKFFVSKIYNGAIMIKKKVCFNFAEIPNVDEMFTFILNALVNFRNMKNAIAHLSQALVALCIQANCWSDKFQMIYSRFPPTEPSNVSVLLSIFISIAEGEEKISFAKKEYLYSLRNTLEQMVPNVFDFIKKSSSIDAKASLDCLSTWIRFVDFPLSTIIQYDLLSFIFEGVKYPNTRDVAIEAFYRLSKVMRIVVNSQQPTADDINSAIMIVQRAVPSVLGAIGQLVEVSKDDEFQFQLVCEFYCEVGFLLTTFSTKIDPALFINYYKLLPEFSMYRSDNIMTSIADCVHDLTDFIVTMPNQQQQMAIGNQLQESYLKLMNNIIRIQTTYVNFDDEDDESLFIDYRKQIIAELVRDVNQIIGSQPILLLIGSICKEALQGNAVLFESALFSFRVLARVYENTNSELIYTILQNIVSLQISEPNILHTCVFCVGRYCDWIHNHRPDFASTALLYIIKHLQNPVLFETTSIAFELICEACCGDLALQFGEISNVFKQIYTQIPQFWKTEHMVCGCKSLIKGYINLLKIQTPEVKVSTFASLVQPLIQQIQQQSTPQMTSIFIGMMTSLIEAGIQLQIQQEIIPMLNQSQLVQSLIMLMDLSIQHNEVPLIQGISDCFGHFMFFVKQAIELLIGELVMPMNRWWNQSHRHQILRMYYDVCSSIQRFVPNSERASQIIFQFIPQVVDEAMQFITQQARTQYEDEIVEVFSIMKYLLSKFPIHFEQSPLQQRLIPWSLICLETTNSFLFRTITSTLSEFFVKYKSRFSNNILQSETFTQIISIILSNTLKTNTSGMKSAAKNFLYSLYVSDPEQTSQHLFYIVSQSYSFLPPNIIEMFGKSRLTTYGFEDLISDFFFICKETN